MTKHGNDRIQETREKSSRMAPGICVLCNGSPSEPFTELRKTRRGGDLGAGVAAREGDFDWDM